MSKMSKRQSVLNVAQEFSLKNYEKITEYADEVQGDLIHNWQVKNREELERLILFSRNSLNFWLDSIVKNKLWNTLIRCGAWIGTLEVRGVMTHGELVEKLDLNYPSTFTEIMKKTADLGLVMISKSGKYKLYSLTDAGIRYAKQIRAGDGEEAFLATIVKKYDLKTNEETLDYYLKLLGSEENGVVIKSGQNIGILTDANRKRQDMKVEKMRKVVSYENEKKPVLTFKRKIEPISYVKA